MGQNLDIGTKIQLLDTFMDHQFWRKNSNNLMQVNFLTKIRLLEKCDQPCVT